MRRLRGEAIDLRLTIALTDPEQDQHSGTDLRHPVALDVDRCLTDALDESPHRTEVSVRG
jgi:hypothetical protein